MQISPQYIAGFLDGEGTIGIEKGKERPNFPHWNVYVQIHNNNKVVVDLLHQKYGGYLATRFRYYEHPSYCWRLNNQRAVDFLAEILPFLIIKDRQAKIAVEFIRNKKRLAPWNKADKSENEVELRRRQKLYEQMRIENQRGRNFPPEEVQVLLRQSRANYSSVKARVNV